MPFIGDIVSGIIGSNAAGKAATAQENAAQQGLQNSQIQQQNSINTQNQATLQQSQNQSPYTSVGASAVNQLGQMASQGYGQTFSAPTAAQAQATPGYQFTLQQGENALQNSAAASGGLLSGNEAAAQQQYGQGLASTTYQQTYNNALSAYQQNYSQYQNQLASLQGLANTGQAATQNVNNLNQAGAQNQGALNYGFAGQQNQQTTNYGNAQASGYIGQANAWNNSMQQLANGLGAVDLTNTNVPSWAASLV
jgi:hypothetical protein